MSLYFVAKTRTSGFVGQMPSDEIVAKFKTGELKDDYVVTESYGPSYAKLIKDVSIQWDSVAEFVARLHPSESVTPSEVQDSKFSDIGKNTAEITSSANDKNIGIGLLVIGGGGLFWVFIRMTNFAGKMHTWSWPLDSYETSTIVVGLIALLCVAIGARKVSAKPPGGDRPSTGVS